MSSRLLPAASTPNKSSATPPSDIAAAPMKNPIASCPVSPESMRWPNRSGPAIPPAAVPTA